MKVSLHPNQTIAERATGMPIAQPKLRIGLLVDSSVVSKYVLEFVRWAQAHERVELAQVFSLSSAEIGQRTSPLQRALMKNHLSATNGSAILFRLAVAIEKLLLLKNPRHYDHLKQFDLSASLEREITYIPRGALGSAAFGLDLLVIFATEPNLAALGEAARLGAIFIGRSDDRRHRGGPPGFWEVYCRDDVTGFTIQRLVNTPDTGEVLLRGATTTQFYYLLNQASLFERSTYYLTRVVDKIATTGRLPEPEASLPFCPIPHSFPRNRESLTYLIGLLRLLASKLLQKNSRLRFSLARCFCPQ